MIKTIYILWLQGFDNAPNIVKKCVQSWYHYNPTWNIIQIDNNNLNQYIDLNELDINFNDNPNILASHISDVIRIILLKKYGGLWCDATLFCNKPLDSWLPNVIHEGFFAFDRPGHDRLISSWFLYGEKDNYIIDKWYISTLNHFKKKYNHTIYFWFHYLFGINYNIDSQFKEIWNRVPKLSANGPHSIILGHGLFNNLNELSKKEIDSKCIPLYKLTYKEDFPSYDEKLNIYYLYSTI